MKILHLFLVVLSLAVSAVASADEEKKVVISGGDQMKYDVTSIDVAAGQKVTVTLTNAGKLPKAAMAHNFVLLKAGTDINAFAGAAISHPDEGYIPPEMRDKIIAQTKLLGPGESETITFTAPAAGVYDYICTFPGHAITGMRGVLKVK